MATTFQDNSIWWRVRVCGNISQIPRDTEQTHSTEVPNSSWASPYVGYKYRRSSLRDCEYAAQEGECLHHGWPEYVLITNLFAHLIQAVTEPQYVTIYAKLSKVMSPIRVNHHVFKNILLNKCHKELVREEGEEIMEEVENTDEVVRI